MRFSQVGACFGGGGGGGGSIINIVVFVSFDYFLFDICYLYSVVFFLGGEGVFGGFGPLWATLGNFELN